MALLGDGSGFPYDPVDGQLQEADLYSEEVLPGAPVVFKNMNVSPSEPLQVDIHIIGKNKAALARYMPGIDPGRY